MKNIRLGESNIFAWVDDKNYDWLMQWWWYATKTGDIIYATRNTTKKQDGIDKAGNHKTVYMHREIMKTPDNMYVDHIDHNGLNCLEENMRNCTRQQNRMNLLPHGVSKYLGVSFHTTKGYTYIKAQIRYDGVTRHIGLFPTEEDAARAYDKLAKEHHGEFANLNFK